MNRTAFRQSVDRLLTIGATASIVASLIPLAATAWWVFELFSHFRVQLLLAQAALALGGLALGRKRWRLALLPCIALNGAAIAPYVIPARHDAADGTEITVLNVNVGYRSESFAGLLQSIERESPDVVVVVEFTDRSADHLRAVASRYPHRVTVPDRGSFGMALLSRYPFERSRTFDLGATVAVDASIAGPGGTFRLLGVHTMPPTSSERARMRNEQLEQLAAIRFASDEPLLITGDFNVSPYSPYFKRLLDRTGLRDTRADRGPALSWPAHFPWLGIPLDHFLASEEFTVTEHRRLPAFGSDHYPVLGRFIQREKK